MTNSTQQEGAQALELKKVAIRILQGLAVAFGVTLVALLMFTAVLYFSDIDEAVVSPVVTGVSLLSLFLGARIAVREQRHFGIGAILGVLYYVILYACALAMFTEFNFSLRTLVFMLIGTLVVGIGAVMYGGQVEKKSNHKKKRR